MPKEVNRLISWVVLSVDENYKRRGIAAALLEYRTDEMVEKGCQGAVTEASAFNSQKVGQRADAGLKKYQFGAICGGKKDYRQNQAGR